MLVLIGGGALLVFFGVALLSVRLVPALVATCSAGLRRGSAAPPDALAQDNARRNPQRTASTASALMIGLALVTLVAVLAAGIVSSSGARSTTCGGRRLRDHRAEQLLADPDLRRGRGREGTRRDRGRKRAHRRGARLRQEDPRDGREPACQGDVQARLDAGLGGGDRRRSGPTASSSTTTTPRTTSSGSARRSTLTFPSGASEDVHRRRDLRSAGRRLPFGRVTISVAAWDRLVDAPRNLYSFVRMQGGATARTQAALDVALDGLPEREGADAGASSSTTRSRG